MRRSLTRLAGGPAQKSTDTPLWLRKQMRAVPQHVQTAIGSGGRPLAFTAGVPGLMDDDAFKHHSFGASGLAGAEAAALTAGRRISIDASRLGQFRDASDHGGTSSMDSAGSTIVTDGRLRDALQVPVAVIDEERLGLPPALVEVLKRRFGITHLTPVQARTLQCVFAMGDTMSCATTGSGKTFGLCIAVVAKLLRETPPQPMSILFLVPTDALVRQVHGWLHDLWPWNDRAPGEGVNADDEGAVGAGDSGDALTRAPPRDDVNLSFAFTSKLTDAYAHARLHRHRKGMEVATAKRLARIRSIAQYGPVDPWGCGGGGDATRAPPDATVDDSTPADDAAAGLDAYDDYDEATGPQRQSSRPDGRALNGPYAGGDPRPLVIVTTPERFWEYYLEERASQLRYEGVKERAKTLHVRPVFPSIHTLVIDEVDRVMPPTDPAAAGNLLVEAVAAPTKFQSPLHLVFNSATLSPTAVTHMRRFMRKGIMGETSSITDFDHDDVLAEAQRHADAVASRRDYHPTQGNDEGADGNGNDNAADFSAVPGSRLEGAGTPAAAPSHALPPNVAVTFSTADTLRELREALRGMLHDHHHSLLNAESAIVATNVRLVRRSAKSSTRGSKTPPREVGAAPTPPAPAVYTNTFDDDGYSVVSPLVAAPPVEPQADVTEPPAVSKECGGAASPARSPTSADQSTSRPVYDADILLVVESEVFMAALRNEVGGANLPARDDGLGLPECDAALGPHEGYHLPVPSWLHAVVAPAVESVVAAPVTAAHQIGPQNARVVATPRGLRKVAQTSGASRVRLISYTLDVADDTPAASDAGAAIPGRGLRRIRVRVCGEHDARGLDLPTLTHVVLATPASNPLEFAHRVGRVGRMGRKGAALVLVKRAWARSASSISESVGLGPLRVARRKAQDLDLRHLRAATMAE
jgi:hypothetical protein